MCQDLSKAFIEPKVLFDHFESLNNNHISNKTPAYSRYIIDSDLDSEIVNDEVWQAIQSLKRSKAPGMDGFPPELFKTFNNELIGLLSDIFTQTLREFTNASYTPVNVRRCHL